MRIAEHDGRKAFELEDVHRLAQEFRKRKNSSRPNAGRQQRARSADRAEIDTVMGHQRLFDVFIEKALADKTPQAVFQEGWQEWVHSATGGRPGGANHLART